MGSASPLLVLWDAPGEAFPFVEAVTLKTECPGDAQLWEAFGSSGMTKPNSAEQP